MSRILSTLATNVRKLRERNGLSLRALAKRAGISAVTIARVEDGRDSSVGTCDLIARALEVEIIDLFDSDLHAKKTLREVTFFEAMQIVTETLSSLRRGEMPSGLLDKSSLEKALRELSKKESRDR